MALVQTSNFDRLIDDIERWMSKGQLNNRFQEASNRILDHVLDSMIAHAPEGTVEPHYNQRPSERIWGQTLEDTLRNPNIKRSDSLLGRSQGRPTFVGSANLEPDHPSYNQGQNGIFEWLDMGTQEHEITGNEWLVFWYGDPLKWGPFGSRTGFGLNYDFGHTPDEAAIIPWLPGLKFFKVVSHPGAGGESETPYKELHFMSLVDEQTSPYVEKQVDQMLVNILNDLDSSYVESIN